MARRIQRQRTSCWRKPPNAVIVTRGTYWGNPFVSRPDLEPGTKFGYRTAVPTVADAIACYREYLHHSPDLIEKARRTLRGKDLACWCAAGEPCHADVLLEIANAEPADVGRPSSGGGESCGDTGSGGLGAKFHCQ